MSLGRGDYFSALSTGGILEERYVEDLLQKMASQLTLEPVPRQLLGARGEQAKITEWLSRLPLRVARGPRSWGGLVVGFPGSGEQLTTEALGTPYLRMILYPMLDLHRRINQHYGGRLPCLYLLGVRFPDVILRKFRLLDDVIPHIVVLTTSLVRPEHPEHPVFPARVDEQWVQVWLRRRMMEPEGLRVPVEDGEICLDYVAHELATGEGAVRSERLDILGVDKDDKSLVVFEIKGPDCGRVELENLFLQGLAHRRWLERNKMAVKFAFDGPRGRRINTRKRVRLLLGFFQEPVPDLFWDMRREAMRDPYMRIDFVGFAHSDGPGGTLKLVPREERDVLE